MDTVWCVFKDFRYEGMALVGAYTTERAAEEHAELLRATGYEVVVSGQAVLESVTEHEDHQHMVMSKERIER